MAGNRTSGILGISANFEPQISAAFDARTNVPNRDDLINPATWVANDGGTYIFNGMTVTVAQDSTPAYNGIYILLDAANVTNLASWLFVGSASGSAITVQDEGVTLTTDVQQFNFTGGGVTATAVGNNVTVDIPVGGEIYYGGDGIIIDTVSTGGPYIDIDLYTAGCVATHGPNLEFVTNKLNFKGVHVQDEGTVIGTYPVINFVGGEVLAQEQSGDGCIVDVYIPPPTFASHYNTTDGTTNAIVSEGGLSRKNLRVSSPTTEGNPYSVNGWDNGTLRSCTKFTTPTIQPGQAAGQLVTGFSGDVTGDATLKVEVFDADGTSLLATFTTPTMYQNDTFTSSGANAGITVGITNHQTDTTKWKANISTSVNMGTIFGNQVPARDGGRYNIKTTFTTDTATDGGGTYTFTQASVFYDTGSVTLPTVSSMTITEAALQTKHISGVEYYKLNSQFDVLVSDIDILNPNTQGYNNGSTYNLRIAATDYGVTTYNIPMWNPNSVGGISGATTPGWDNFYNTNNIDFNWGTWPITANNYRYRGAAANGTANVYHPWSASGGSTNSPNQSILIDTVTATASNLSESFNDESERLFRNGATYATWSSLSTLTSGTAAALNYGYQSLQANLSEACCVGSYLIMASRYFLTDPSTSTIQPNLTTFKPDSAGANPDYTALTQPAVFSRRWYATLNPTKPITKMTMTFAGDAGTSGNFLQALLDRNLLIYVRRTGSSNGGNTGYGANPTILHAAPGNPNSGEFSSAQYDDANLGTDLIGAQMMQTTGSNNVVDGVFGSSGQPGDCVGGFWTDIIIVDQNIEIEAISCVVTFNDGSTE